MCRSRSFSFTLLAPLLALLSLSNTQGTEIHPLTVHQVLRIAEAEVAPVTYITWYGGLEETTLGAMSWPTVIGTPHDEVAKEDRNWMSLLGVRVQLQTDEEGQRLVVDLTEMKPPESFKADDGALGKAVFESFFKAATLNLRKVGVYDCPLSIRGEQAFKSLAGLEIPKVLNPVAALWETWPYQSLQKVYRDGDLQELAASSLTDTTQLHTLLLIVSSEQHSPEAKDELRQFLREVLRRVGDERFAQALTDTESAMVERVHQALGESEDWKRWFPKTASTKAP